MTDRRGFALIVVMLLMAVGTALMLSAIDASLTDADVALAETQQRRALVAAESGMRIALSGADADALRHSPLGTTSVSTETSGDITLIATVDRVDTAVVWIVATATIHRSGVTVARHRVGMSALIPDDTADHTLHPVPERAWADLF
jgi:Tfp pilus assembly protein PilX